MARATPDIIVGEDGVPRCWWAGTDPLYCAYHDREWGFPVKDDRRLFEKVCLEGFQSGLAWITILRKRENFRAAFRNFEIEAVARMNQRSVERLLRDAGIVRHRGKIESTLNNARRARELIRDEGSLGAFFWRHEPGGLSRPGGLSHPGGLSRPGGPTRATLVERTTSAESLLLAKTLKARGWSFVGPTTLYAFMQAMGLVNDHVAGCGVRAEAEAARQRFRRPSVMPR